ncbi:MAG: dihydropteroate synthase [Sphingobacteriales bacterium]|uniref:dihydropteroate synthase n=1 Tax=Hydrotalea flava TaxID=714549 RepID=UPI0008318E74|nr:dihydropteroate synthase [Hydrotalea flava]RTL56779.1 MAG: dihydropteroate synthase [Sphingobacteriales bacterium]
MYTLNCNGRLLVIEKPIIMGIINATPDSFFKDSRQTTIQTAVEQAEKMTKEGAVIIDIGGQSTHPKSSLQTAATEMERIIPVITQIRKTLPEVFISVDTFYASVAKAAVEAGADILNDISGGNLDPKMIETVANLHVPYICMHMQGTPQTMQKYTSYEDICLDIVDYFIKKATLAKEAGIIDMIIDPGIGFSKNIQQNFLLIKQLSIFQILHKPILLGISRKSFLYKTLQKENASEALNATTAMHMVGLINGANILRVHDVAAAQECITLYNAYMAS